MERPPDPTAWLEAVRQGKARIEEVRRAADGCRACPLWENATQTVFGEGPVHPHVLLVGEQPGDREDLEGRPFVGPAGRLLDQSLAAAGLERTSVWVTNAVKHFKWRAKGKRRIHEKPNAREVRACRPWFEAEVAALAPEVIVCLGATAATAVLGSRFKLTQHRGEFVASPLAPHVTATVHPSSILRAPDAKTRQRETAHFVADLERVAKLLERLQAA